MPAKTILKKDRAVNYIKIMEKWHKKTMVTKELSLESGVVEDVVANELANFDSLIRLFPDYNILQILPELKKRYQPTKTKRIVKPSVVEPYRSTADYIYQTMTMPGGIVDKNMVLSKAQLKILKKVVNQELKKLT